MSYLMQQEGQELNVLVRGQRLQVRLLEAVQVLVFGLKGDRVLSLNINQRGARQVQVSP